MNSFYILYGDFGTLPNMFNYSNVNIPRYLDNLNEIMNNFADYYSNSWGSSTDYWKLFIKIRIFILLHFFFVIWVYLAKYLTFFLHRYTSWNFSSINKSRTGSPVHTHLEESPNIGHDCVVSEDRLIVSLSFAF